MDIETLFNRHRDAVYRQILRVCHGHREDAEDALAEALLAALRASAELREERSFRAWLTTIATRVCLRMRRSDLVELVRLSLPEISDLVASNGPLPDEEAELREFKEFALRVPSMLSTRYRAAYIEVDLNGCSIQEMARRCGITVAAAKSRLRRARKMVRARLDSVVTGQSATGGACERVPA
ncbi:MAG TPA: RNA polymerase sigma factor [Fimbriimonadaceae bacterium]|nr:RNA polymerase sigma factor [Fimbriimonadaceae bacterium]